ncbi:MAG: phosphotransferase [Pseudomonadota bacterium]
MIEDIAKQALEHWSPDTTELVLIAQRENVVFRVTDTRGSCFALRLHRPGYQTDNMIRSELSWMQYLETCGLAVPAPVPTVANTHLTEVEGYRANLLTWLSGRPLGATGAPLTLAGRAGTFEQIGALMARVYLVSDQWDMPSGFERQH